MRLRQIALVAEALEPAVEDLSQTLELEVCFRDPGVAEFGLENALLLAGDTFLEVVSPKQEGTTEEGTTAGRLLERRGGDGGYMVLLQSEDLDADRKRLEELSVRVVWQIELPDIAAIHLHPKDVGGAIVSFDVPRPASAWRWGGPDWETRSHSKATSQLIGVEIQAQDPKALAARWAEVVSHPVIDSEDGCYEIPLEGGRLRFVRDRDGRGEGVAAVEFAVHERERILSSARERGLPVEPDAFIACGTRILLRDAT
jgi:hypothetical protein